MNAGNSFECTDMLSMISLFDNDVTYLYKYACIENTPAQFMVVFPRPPDAPENIVDGYTDKYIYMTIMKFIEYYENNKDANIVNQIYQEIKQYHKALQFADFIMIYYIWYYNDELDEDELFQFFNTIYTIHDPKIHSQFKDVIDLDNTNNRFLEKWNEYLSNDNQKLREIIKIQEQLEKLYNDHMDDENIMYNEQIVHTMNLRYEPITSLTSGLDIFNESVISTFVPFIRYVNGAGQMYTKIFTGTDDEVPPYDVFIISKNETYLPQTIYINMWLGDPHNTGKEKLSLATLVNMTPAFYHLEQNILDIEIPVDQDVRRGLIIDKNIMIKRLVDSLPSLELVNGLETNSKIEFDIMNQSYDESVLLYLILNDPLLQEYLYINESLKPNAYKRRLELEFHSLLARDENAEMLPNYQSDRITFTLSRLTKSKRVGKGKKQDIPYLNVSITKSSSHLGIHVFQEIFRLLLFHYNTQYRPIHQLYHTILPQTDEIDQLLDALQTSGNILGGTKESKISTELLGALKDIAPDIFIEGYARVCQGQQKPTIVSPEEAVDWTNQGNQVMEFPRENPHLFVCTDPVNKYPKLICNKELKNKDIYNYLPCCGTKDKLSPNIKSHYNDYINERPVRCQSVTTSKKSVITNKILAPNVKGEVPRVVSEILIEYYEELSGAEHRFKRYGVIRSPNSLLHCVFLALQDEAYLEMDSTEREKYVSDHRLNMAQNILPEVAKQEMYDYSLEDIKTLLSDNDIFLDPLLFYRAVEEYFSLSIYIFGVSADDGEILIPRHSKFHASRYAERTTITIMRMLSETSYPQCELIVNYAEDSLEFLYDFRMDKICHEAIKKTLKTFTWSIDVKKNDYNELVWFNKLLANENIYDINYSLIFGTDFQPIGQTIDNNGKTRTITWASTTITFTIATIPSQPLNIPIDNRYSYIEYSLAVRKFGKPNALSLNDENLIEGLWYDKTKAFNPYCILIHPHRPKKIKLPVVPSPIIEQTEMMISQTKRLSILKRTINILKQLVIWIYQIYRQNQKKSVDKFIDKYFIISSEKVNDSSTFYDVNIHTSQLPQNVTVEKALSFVKKYIPQFVQNHKLVMYNEEFYKRMTTLLRDYAHLYPVDTIPQLIKGFYRVVSDFYPVENGLIFLSFGDFDEWLSVNRFKEYNYTISNTINALLSESYEPILYQGDTQKIYLIQNVRGNIQQAMAVAMYWYLYKINMGYDSPSSNIIFPHIIYEISSSQKLVMAENYAGTNENALHIIRYSSRVESIIKGVDRYASMLEL